MSDWKGTLVGISVYKHWTELGHNVEALLDTDTITNLFEKYPPSEYTYEIYPLVDNPFEVVLGEVIDD